MMMMIKEKEKTWRKEEEQVDSCQGSTPTNKARNEYIFKRASTEWEREFSGFIDKPLNDECRLIIEAKRG